MNTEADKKAREMTDTIIDALELKIRAGEWVSLDAVRRELHTIIASYEKQLAEYRKLHEVLNKVGAEQQKIGEEE